KDEILGTEDSDNVIIRNTTDEIQFDWDEAMNNIYINGKKTQYPKTVASMGKGFSLGALAFQNKSGNEYMGYDTVTASVMHKDARIASAIIKGTVSTFDAKDPVLIWAVTSGNDNCELQGIYKFRLGDSVTVEELVEFFGTPTLRSEYKVVYEYEAPALKYIEFVISQKTGKLEGLIVGNRDEESKNKTSDEKTSDKKSLDEKSSDKKASEEKVPDNVIIRDTPGELQFDIDEAMKNIYIQGKKVPFPDTVANMGNGFSLDSNASDVRNDIEYYGFDEVITDVLYEGKVIGEAILKASAADLDANDPILYLSLMKSDDMDKWQGIYKFRLGDDISKEDIK
ncbi:MAG: hypothetical protein LBC41_04545, partial [Clostridiales bacterium]|nr:hypothetical protein [Clostridiales bacterium]